MNYLGGRCSEYLADWSSGLHESWPDAWSNVIGGNAMMFFGLQSGEMNRTRLDEFFKWPDGLKPAWARLVDFST